MVRGEAQTGLEYNGGDFNNQIHNTSTTTSWDLPPDIHAIPSNQYVLYPANPLNNVGFVDNSWSVYDGFESPWTQELWPSPSAPFPTMEPGYPGSPWFPSLQSSSSSFRSPANGFDDMKQSDELLHPRQPQRASPESFSTVRAQRFPCGYCPKTYKKSNGRNRHEKRNHGCGPKRPGRPRKSQRA
ncbi:hypothetical protein ASPWEDRAFT_34320 [Aspergillus wentii DTO 134E9]|uniref:C2H2-type domain-containing protein n=1 Tax=Aspergillus wentii DTO 134E9 TaxID=1073089 RepID=A0A1L9S112_ASPWE|nr:uncharacterized protein ASPWEDRAFT_34320 [Aspergillus wentii DTO 134E9]OJJ40849.1 hypothetical protein ASPWEDRAFT_34320 [Aspergillus wentii DTO 134E9]